MQGDLEDVDQRITELTERIEDLRSKCQYKSAWRVTQEMKRLAKAERRVIPYLTANFYLMNDAQSLLEPEQGAEAAIESIALLESEERAREFQPDFPEQHYYHTVSWMSSCAYDNLAKHVATRDGYNSEGVHDCINDGIQVCHRTGKLECVTCFREYATDVYKAGDDLEMALHHARFVTSHHDPDANSDRRWVGSLDVTEIELQQGQLAAAYDALLKSIELVDTYHHPFSGRRSLRDVARTLFALRGQSAEFENFAEAHGLGGDIARELDPGEDPQHEYDRDLALCVVDSCAGRHDEALARLTKWERVLSKNKRLANWFEVRLRIVATLLLSGQREKAEALVSTIEPKAKQARDYSTLRRLKGMLDGRIKPAPTAPSQSLSEGPFSADSSAPTASVASAVSSSGDHADAADDEAENTPLRHVTASLRDRLFASSGETEVLSGLLVELLAQDVKQITHPDDASWFLYLGAMLARFTGRVQDVWDWGKSLIQTFPRDPGVMNLTADLAAVTKAQIDDLEEADKIASDDQIERWFRESLELDADRPNNFARAGYFFQSQNKLGDAERCYARGFRLARGDSRIALALAEIYADSDRPRDALGVLDMCIREGCDDPHVFWQAGLVAAHIEKWEWALSYLDKHEEISPDQPWAHYYRALAFLELERPRDALESIDRESVNNPDAPLPALILRACAHALLEEPENYRRYLGMILETRLKDVDYLTTSALEKLYERLYAVSDILSEPTPEIEKLEELMLQAGLAPTLQFSRIRQKESPQTELNYYIVRVLQRLDETWADHPGCLHEQGDWTAYECYWGILAADEEAAEETVLAWQSRCFPDGAEILSTEQHGEDIEDLPGIIFQSSHQPEPNSDDGEGDQEELDDDDFSEDPLDD